VGAVGAGEPQASLDARDGVAALHSSSVAVAQGRERHGGGAAKVIERRVSKWEWFSLAAEAAIYLVDRSGESASERGRRALLQPRARRCESRVSAFSRMQSSARGTPWGGARGAGVPSAGSGQTLRLRSNFAIAKLLIRLIA
jgi:hypothetical protein